MSYLLLEQLQNKINQLHLQLEIPGLNKQDKQELKDELEVLETEMETRQYELSGY